MEKNSKYETQHFLKQTELTQILALVEIFIFRLNARSN
jgi:hypothetical protein